MHDSNWWFMGHGFGMILWWLLPIVAIVLFIVWINKQNPKQSQESVVDILKKRYAKGEITKEQFDKMKNDLES